MLDSALVKKLQEEEEKTTQTMFRIGREGETAYLTATRERRQREKERQITVEFERMQSQLSTELRQQVELNYQRKFQEVQQHTPRGQAKEIPKTIKIQVENKKRWL